LKYPAERITGNKVSSNQFVNSILQKERFVTEKFRKIQINFVVAEKAQMLFSVMEIRI